MYSNLKTKSYKLDIYLIERTKKLEGILCQSLSFTNTLKRNFNTEPAPFLLNRTEGQQSVLENIDMRDQFTNPVVEGESITLKSLVEMGNIIRIKHNDYFSNNLVSGEPYPSNFHVVPTLQQGSEDLQSSIIIVNDGEETKITALATNYTFLPKKEVKITYNVAWEAKGNQTQQELL